MDLNICYTEKICKVYCVRIGQEIENQNGT